jgi:hypothetical protein
VAADVLVHELPRRHVQGFLAARDHGYPDALGDEGTRDCEPDSAASPGDDRPLAS